MNINTKEYWDAMFSKGQWKTNGGEEQTRYFAESQIKYFRIQCDFSGTLLDFGCGLGDAFPVYRKILPNAKLLGVDFSEAAIKKCKKKYGDFVVFIKGDVEDVPNVDVIVASNVLEHLSNDKAVANILCSKCKELYITVPYREQHPIVEHVNIYDRNAFNELSPQEVRVFPSKGWSQYGIRGLYWQFYAKNFFRPFFGKSIQRRRLQMMIKIKGKAVQDNLKL